MSATLSSTTRRQATVAMVLCYLTISCNPSHSFAPLPRSTLSSSSSSSTSLDLFSKNAGKGGRRSSRQHYKENSVVDDVFLPSFLPIIPQEKEEDHAAGAINERKFVDFFDYQEKRRALSNCPIFLNLSEEEMENIAKSMKPKQVAKGDVLVKEGTIGESMYFVAQGSFACFREDGTKGASNVVRTCNETDYFGELGAVFGKPRQVSVRAMTDATVWELHKDSFLNSYRTSPYRKYGAASYWLAPLGNALTKQNWTRKIAAKFRLQAFKSFFLRLSNFFNFVRLLDLHFTRQHQSGSRAHLINIILAVAFPSYFIFRRQPGGSMLCNSVMSITFLALIYDNLIMAVGKYVGEGETLRKFSKLRCVLHGFSIPVLFLPLVEVASSCGLLAGNVSKIMYSLIVAFTLHEVTWWSRFDPEEMVLVDNRDSTSSSARQMAGTLMYSSGKVLKNVLPVVAVQLSLLTLGSMLWKRGFGSGLWMLLSGSVCLFTCSLQRPGVQAIGETLMMGLLWFALV